MSTPAAAANENGNEDKNSEKIWQKNDKEFLLVVVTFIATVAFQAGINPPGGAWQDDDKNHIAGKSIMATKEPVRFIAYIVSTTVGMSFSMVQVLVMLNELPYKRLSVSRNFLLVSCSFAILSMAVAYWSAVTALTPKWMLELVTITLITIIVLGFFVLSILVCIQRRSKCTHC